MRLLNEWRAFARRHPLFFDEKYIQARADWNASMVATSVWNALTAVFSRRGSRLKPGQFMFKEPAPLSRNRTGADLFQDLKAILRPVRTEKHGNS